MNNLLGKKDLLDRQIDNFVYELYELTPEEIKIVEGECVGLMYVVTVYTKVCGIRLFLK